jgi:hypothetical protein
LVGENSKAVILHVEFIPIRVAEADRERDDALWRWVDETSIDAVERRRLIDNGLRLGRVINREKFRAQLEPLRPAQGVVEDFLASASVAADVSHNEKRIPMRIGKRYELMLRKPIRGSQVVLARLEDELVGRTVEDPQFLLALTSTPGNGAEQIQLRLRPEIQFGESQPQWVSSGSALRIDTRRESWSLDQLDIHLDLTEGQTFALTAGIPLSGLAEQMLTGQAADQTELRVVLLIRAEQIPGPRDTF